MSQQWSRQKSGGDSAVRSEFVIAGMIFHPSRVQSQLLHKYLEQAFVEVTLLPACHREDVWLLALLGLDHGVGHSLLLLYDVKAPNDQKSNEFKDLGHCPSDASLRKF